MKEKGIGKRGSFRDRVGEERVSEKEEKRGRKVMNQREAT